MFFIFFIFFIFFSCSIEREEPEEVFARVGEKKLTKEDIVAMKKRGLISEGSVSHLVNGWIEKMLLYEAAINSNLDKDEFLIKKRDVFYKDLLISSFLNIKAKKEIYISRQEVSNYYKENKKSFTLSASKTNSTLSLLIERLKIKVFFKIIFKRAKFR